jgi:hypothetical protein
VCAARALVLRTTMIDGRILVMMPSGHENAPAPISKAGSAVSSARPRRSAPARCRRSGPRSGARCNEWRFSLVAELRRDLGPTRPPRRWKRGASDGLGPLADGRDGGALRVGGRGWLGPRVTREPRPREPLVSSRSGPPSRHSERRRIGREHGRGYALGPRLAREGGRCLSPTRNACRSSRFDPGLVSAPAGASSATLSCLRAGLDF